MHVYMYALWRLEVGGLPQLFFLLYFETACLSEPGANVGTEQYASAQRISAAKLSQGLKLIWIKGKRHTLALCYASQEEDNT